MLANRKTIAVCAIGVGLRLALAASSLPHSADLPNYTIVANIMRDGGNVYAQTSGYNYAPVWMYVLHALNHLADLFGLRFHFLIYVLLSAGDVVVALLLGRIALAMGRSGTAAVVSYMLNPIAVLLTGLHGQFDNLAAIPLLTAVLLSLQRRPAAPQWFWCTASLLVKHVLAFSVWTFLVSTLSLRRALLFASGAAVAFVSSFVPFLPEGADGILHNVLLYSSQSGAWGLGLFLPHYVHMMVFVSAMLLLPIMAKRAGFSLAQQMEMAAVAFIALTPGIARQYLLIPIVFGAERRRPGYWLFTFAALPFLLYGFGLMQWLPLPELYYSLSWAISLAWLWGLRAPDNSNVRLPYPA